MKLRARVVTGLQPTGPIHWGNYFGMLQPMLRLVPTHDVFCFIADFHALTSTFDPEQLRQNTHRAALDLLGCGVDPRHCVLFRQSDIPEVTELMWVLSNVISTGRLLRSHSYKDKIAHRRQPSHGLLSYPVLMAADILAYQGELIPAGRDQQQHLEITREIALRFNHAYGDTFRLPEPIIAEQAALVPGIDGRKMSKTGGNAIGVFDDERALRQHIMSIVTTSHSIGDPKDPEGQPLFDLYRRFATASETDALMARFRRGGLGYAEMKGHLYEKALLAFAAARARRADWATSPGTVSRILTEGARRARSVAQATINTVRRAVGLE